MDVVYAFVVTTRAVALRVDKRAMTRRSFDDAAPGTGGVAAVTCRRRARRFAPQGAQAALSAADDDFIAWAAAAGVKLDKLRVAAFDGAPSACTCAGRGPP